MENIFLENDYAIITRIEECDGDITAIFEWSNYPNDRAPYDFALDKLGDIFFYGFMYPSNRIGWAMITGNECNLKIGDKIPLDLK